MDRTGKDWEEDGNGSLKDNDNRFNLNVNFGKDCWRNWLNDESLCSSLLVLFSLIWEFTDVVGSRERIGTY